MCDIAILGSLSYAEKDCRDLLYASEINRSREKTTELMQLLPSYVKPPFVVYLMRDMLAFVISEGGNGYDGTLWARNDNLTLIFSYEIPDDGMNLIKGNPFDKSHYTNDIDGIAIGYVGEPDMSGNTKLYFCFKDTGGQLYGEYAVWGALINIVPSPSTGGIDEIIYLNIVNNNPRRMPKKSIR